MMCAWRTENESYADMAREVTVWLEASRQRPDKGHPGPVSSLGRGSWREGEEVVLPSNTCSFHLPRGQRRERGERDARLGID